MQNVFLLAKTTRGALEKLTTYLQLLTRTSVLSWTWRGVWKASAFISFAFHFIPCPVLSIINPEITRSGTVQQRSVHTISFCINPFTWKLNFNWKIGLWRNPQPVSAQLQQCSCYNGKLLMLATVHVVCGICFRFNISIQGHDYVLMLQAGDFMHLTSILCIIDLAVPEQGSNHTILCYSFWINCEQNICINYSYSDCFCYVSLGSN